MLADLKLSNAYDGMIFLAETRRNPPFLKSHRHVELELNLVVQGSITYIVSGKRFTFTRGTMLWIFPAQEHELVDRSPDARYYVAVFKHDLIERACHGENYNDLKNENIEGEGLLSKRLKMESFDMIRRTMDTLMDDALDPDLLNKEAGFGVHSDFRYQHGDPDTLNAGLRYLLILCWRYYRTGLASGNAVQLHPAVRKAMDQLGEGDVELGLREVAANCGVSDAYLSRLFRRQVGVPLNRYRNSVRLSRFMDHYTQPEHRTILESVYASGFGSYAQFYKVFLNSYGCGPSRYLRVDKKVA